MKIINFSGPCGEIPAPYNFTADEQHGIHFDRFKILRNTTLITYGTHSVKRGGLKIPEERILNFSHFSVTLLNPRKPKRVAHTLFRRHKQHGFSAPTRNEHATTANPR